MTHYQRLGITPAASPAEVRAAYRRAAVAHHPDTHGERSAQQMAEINTAWSVLRDPVRRQAYDLTLAPPTSPSNAAEVRRTGESGGSASFGIDELEIRQRHDRRDRLPGALDHDPLPTSRLIDDLAEVLAHVERAHGSHRIIIAP